MEAVLEAQARDTFGKNEARRTRRGGQVPGVLYGGDGRGATPIAVQPKALLKILPLGVGAEHPDFAQARGRRRQPVPREGFQLDPITHEVLHVDFFKIAMDKLLQVTIPIVVHGEPKGVKQQGGILEFIRREVVIEVLPADIPSTSTSTSRS
jgi:large subunit ribosomal protein L25